MYGVVYKKKLVLLDKNDFGLKGQGETTAKYSWDEVAKGLSFFGIYGSENVLKVTERNTKKGG